MNFTAKLMHRIMSKRTAIHPHRRRRCSKKQATTSAKRPKTACLPQDVLTSILVRLPGSDLRRLRRVCKEWRDIIADQAFIQAHMVHGPRTPLTHTIVFFPGFAYGSRWTPCNGRGFLFDEHWRVTAELAADVWDDFVGASNGLLCFLEIGKKSIKVVEPFTGESLALPAEASGVRWTVNSGAYCFGYDAATRRYKIVHYDFVKDGARPGCAMDDQELHVYTIGGGGAWTRLHVAFAIYGWAYGDPVYVDGAVYWPSSGHGKRGKDKKLVRFDLATEKITLEAAKHLRLETPRPETARFCRPVDSMPCVMTYGWSREWDVWFPGAEEAGLLEGSVLLCESLDHGLYLLRRMERSLEFGRPELLFEASKEQPWWRDHTYNSRTSFVPVSAHLRQQHLPIAGALPLRRQYQAGTFGYSPTVSNAPLALYFDFGTPSP